ncbi:MAG: tryptophan--tRNA ligase [Pseudomonadota bacterium]
MTTPQRIISGMRPTGQLHLGHYHGVLKNWVKLQHEYDCFFSVVDIHALTTHYDDPEIIETNTWNMVIDWLAAGINPNSAHIYLQSRIPEIAELHLILSMITPLGWLERIPTYKSQIDNIKEKDLHTYGFLGYPLLMSSDIMIFKSGLVPVGEDQVPHIEFAREVARRFNHLYGREPDYQQKAEAAASKLGKKNANLYRNLYKQFQEQGSQEALETARALVESVQHISVSDKDRLLGYLEGGGKIILPEPEPMLTSFPVMSGLDGRKMSKSYHNTIMLSGTPDDTDKKIKKMPTDPARVRRNDPGEPEKCPVWALHKVYSNEDTKEWVQHGCRSAGIGCLDCKKPLIDAIISEQQPIRQRANDLREDHDLVRNIINEGCEAARDIARETIEDVKEVIGLSY